MTTMSFDVPMTRKHFLRSLAAAGAGLAALTPLAALAEDDQGRTGG
ncbi:MAG: hypothetical protein ACTHNK_11680 [Thermomicrobiales bacterium]